MTSSPDPSFWRIFKVNSNDRQDIREGEAVRFSWQFSDQTSGFRDFMDDSFGRRRFSIPDGANNAQFIKIPFPGFHDSSNNEFALVMSGANTPNPVLEPFQIRPNPDDPTTNVTYNLHDLVFRLDYIGQFYILLISAVSA